LKVDSTCCVLVKTHFPKLRQVVDVLGISFGEKMYVLLWENSNNNTYGSRCCTCRAYVWSFVDPVCQSNSRLAVCYWMERLRNSAAFEIPLPSDCESFRYFATTESGKIRIAFWVSPGTKAWCRVSIDVHCIQYTLTKVQYVFGRVSPQLVVSFGGVDALSTSFLSS
jgi:hypothetical protein